MILKNNDMRLIVIGDIKLLPGCNDADDKLLKKYSEPSDKYKNGEYDIKEIFKTNNIEKITHKKDGKEVEFKDFPMLKKEDIVNNTYNVGTLQAWRKVESDVSVKILIEDRLKGIKDKTIKDVKNYGVPKGHV